MKQPKNHSRGFTLIELLVVIGIIATLGAISFPVYTGMKKKMDKQELKMMYNSIEIAVENFETEYNYLPYAQAAYPAADSIYNHIGSTMDILTGMLMGLESTKNFKQIKFLELKDAEGSGPHAAPGPAGYRDGVVDMNDGTARLYNSNGLIYAARIDHNLDGEIAHPFGGEVINGYKIVLYSPLSAWALPYSDWIASFPWP